MSRSPLTFLPKGKKVVGMAIGAMAMLAVAVPAWSQEVFGVTTLIQVPSAESNTAGTLFSFDISWVDPGLQRYFLADRNNKAIDVISTDNPNNGVIAQFFAPFAGFTGNNDTSGPNGVLALLQTAQQGGGTELWIGDSNTNCASPPCDGSTPAKTPGSGRVWIMDAVTGAILPPSPILVGGNTRADELCFDPINRVIMIASPSENFVTFISTGTAAIAKGTILGQLSFDGGADAGHVLATNGIEQCGWSPFTHLFYQNIPASNGTDGKDDVPGVVAVISPTTRTVMGKPFVIPIDAFAGCAGPQGMAMGPNNQILLGCNAASPLTPPGPRNSVIIDAITGTVLQVLANLGGADQVWFNPGNGRYIIPSCNTPCRTVPGNGPTGPELLGIVNSNGFNVDQLVTVAVQNGDTNVTSGNPRTAHSVAADPETHAIFLPVPACNPPTGCGNVPHFTPTICDLFDPSTIVRVGNPSTAKGCIAVLTTAVVTPTP